MLTECVEHHESCVREKSSLPKRVLDVSKSASRVFVHVSDGQEDNSRYMALSYAWGIGLPLKTVKANLKSHRESGIPLTSLPRTIRDAVLVTRALHCRYLWVDAFCIIQDDDLDWEEQSSRMTDIYREAILTISASSSKSMETGFLERPIVNETALKLGSYHHHEAPGIGDLLIRPLEDKIHGEATITKGYLNSRGWIFQERLASTAVVHYTDEEIVWECNHGPRSETMGMQTPFDWGSSELKTITKVITWREVFDTWMLWVIRYSRRDLTKRKDRLPAVGGLAKVLSLRFGITYIAGLWRESLPAGLLWFRVLDEPEKEGTETNRDPHVPSWSWGSVSGPIGFRGW
ncbi:heterokaryon incompatibility protein-domain-containing protein, partial [Usnea florida]